MGYRSNEWQRKKVVYENSIPILSRFHKWWFDTLAVWRGFLFILSFMLNETIVKAALFGVAVGDALGVPVEFRSRTTLLNARVTDMIGYGTHNQPLGTWSDDSSLTFCLADALCEGLNLEIIAQKFIEWRSQGLWTPHGNVFDIGIATNAAIHHLKTGTRPDLAGGFDENENGNGSLMRILPLLFFVQNKTIEERYHFTKLISSITHGHIRSVISCFYYLEFARLLLLGADKNEAYQAVKPVVKDFLQSKQINQDEMDKFHRLLKQDISDVNEDAIYSSGYVLHSLEASMWCLLTTSNYKDAVLKGVNLGSDTDTTGAITGGLAALAYGLDAIPKNWIDMIVRKNDIEDLANRLAKSLKTLV